MCACLVCACLVCACLVCVCMCVYLVCVHVCMPCVCMCVCMPCMCMPCVCMPCVCMCVLCVVCSSTGDELIIPSMMSHTLLYFQVLFSAVQFPLGNQSFYYLLSQNLSSSHLFPSLDGPPLIEGCGQQLAEGCDQLKTNQVVVAMARKKSQQYTG